MPRKVDYVPAKNAIFNEWQENLVSLVTTNATTWSIGALTLSDLTSAKSFYQPLYNAIVNKATRTPQQVAAHKVGRKAYEAFLRGFVKEYLIANRNIPYDDKLALGLNPSDGARQSRPAITTAPEMEVKALGGLRIQIVSRVESDESRPSIQADADGLELRYKIDTVPPANYLGTNEIEFSTKARFTMNISPEQTGKNIYVFARWKNNNEPAKSGPWSGISSTTIR